MNATRGEKQTVIDNQRTDFFFPHWNTQNQTEDLWRIWRFHCG